MTPDQIEAERVAFEAHYDATVDTCGLYVPAVIQSMWVGWLARAERSALAERVAEMAEAWRTAPHEEGCMEYADGCNCTDGQEGDLCDALAAWREVRDCVDLILERDGIKHSRACPYNVAAGGRGDEEENESPCLRCQRDTLQRERNDASAQLAKLNEFKDAAIALWKEWGDDKLADIETHSVWTAWNEALAACDAKEDNPCK